MAGKSAILSVRIIADAAKAAAGFGDAERQVESFTGKLDRISPVVDKAAGYATVAAGAYTAFAYDAMQSASELEQSTGAVNSVFKEQAGIIEDLAKNAATNVGLAESQYKEMSAVLGSQLMNLGVSQSEVTGTTEELIGLGADLASMFGGTTSEAVESLSSLLRGERDPIEKYAVSINQAAIEAKMAEMGLSDLEGQELKNAETQATLALLFDQTADAQGNFARETDTAAGSAQIAAAQWENAKATLGEQFLPIAVQAAEIVGKFAEKLGEHPELFMNLGIAIGIAVTALSGLSGTIKIVQTLIPVFKALNAVVAANPFMAVVTVIALVAAGLITAYQESETFRRIVDNAASWVVDKFKIVVEWVKSVGEWIKGLGNPFTKMGDIASDQLSRVQGWLKTARDWINKLIDIATTPGRKLAAGFETAIAVIERLIGWLRSARDWISSVADKFSSSSFDTNGKITASTRPDMTAELAASEILKFSATAPDITATRSEILKFTASADVTAQAADAPVFGGATGGTALATAPTVTNITYQIQVDGALDADRTAEQIIRLIKRHNDRQGW